MLASLNIACVAIKTLFLTCLEYLCVEQNWGILLFASNFKMWHLGKAKNGNCLLPLEFNIITLWEPKSRPSASGQWAPYCKKCNK